MTRRAGLTLVELLVVLTILVALAGIGLRSTLELEQQARFEATQRALEEAREGILSRPAPRTDGALTTRGFVSDVGRLPRATALLDGPINPVVDLDGNPVFEVARELLQGRLWDDSAPIAPYGRYPTSDDEVQLYCGWRGPYLDLGAGRLELNDGWGRRLKPLTYFESSPGVFDLQLVSAESDLVYGFMSRGADGRVDGPGTHDLDVLYALDHDRVEVSLSVTVNVTITSGTRRVFLRVFAPSAAGAVELEPLPSHFDVTSAMPPPRWALDPDDFVIPGAPPTAYVLTAGPRILRAYLDDDGAGQPGNGTWDPNGPDVPSQVHDVVLLPGMNHVTLTIP